MSEFIQPSEDTALLMSEVLTPVSMTALLAAETDLEVCSNFAKVLQRHGWGAITIDQDDVFARIRDWSEVFHRIFTQPAEVLEAAGLYRSELGVSIGYRHDEERNFVECRMNTFHEVNPVYTDVERYQDMVRDIFDLLCPVAERILQGIAATLELDPSVFVDLTDVHSKGRLPERTVRRNDEMVTVPGLSSSLLRICQYLADTANTAVIDTNQPVESQKHHKVAFGAHTDTSFLTLGLCAATPAIEMADPISNRWICPEQTFPPNTIVVFVGEFIQVLTKSRYVASVHRVGMINSGCRISCPLIVREHPDAVVSFASSKYQHPGGYAAIAEDKVPDFDDMTMKMIHKILEVKRKRCFEQHGSREGNWVLSSFPVEKMPPE